jgi:hypothetical protein
VPGEEGRVQASGMAIRSTIKMVIDISYRFNLDLAFISILALPLPSIFIAYKASLLHIQLADEQFLDEEWNSDMESLKVTLQYFSKRWSIGSELSSDR